MINRAFIFFILSSIAFSSCSVIKFAKIYLSSDREEGKLIGDVYTKRSTNYRIGELDSDLQKVDINYGDLFFANKNNTAAVTVNSTCQTSKVNNSLSSLSGSLLIGIKEKKLLERNLIYIDDEEALFSVYKAQVEGSRLKIATAVFIKGECVYDFSYSNVSDNFDLYFNNFKEFLGKFSVLER